MINITAILEKGKDGYSVSFNEFPNLFGFGTTLDEAKQDAQSVLNNYIDTLNMLDRPIPSILQDEYSLSFMFDSSTILSYVGSTVTQAALAKVAGINASQLSHYATRRKIPRLAQRQKIVSGLHKIGRELLEIS